MQKDLLVYVNGSFVEKSKAVVSVFDHGLLYGDGVFEGIRAYNGIVFKLDEHIARLYESAKIIRLKLPVPPHEMAERVLETLRKNRLRDAYIRLVVTRGPGDLGVDPTLCSDPTLFIITEPMATVLGPREPKVVQLIVSTVRRDAVDATTHEIKSLNYLNSIMAKIEANSVGADDAILLDRRGFVSEASVTNLFIVKEGKVATPSSAAGILHGITRARVIKLCNDLGIDVQERDVTPFEVFTADEVFLVGTKSEIVAAGSVKDVTIGTGAAGPITRRLVKEFSKLVQRPEEGTPIYRAVKVRA
ncbi:MAG TPA: branched-chain-amino-acid transaminase [Nitrososphaerales archaeon]|nr:branched-chain-amino-acid transaminase [Nitrososphaerales archaeon]